MAQMEDDQSFVEYVVKAIVDHPSDVATDRTVDERGVLIQLHANPEDMGKIIGKEGRTAKSLRTLLRVLGAKNNARVNLKIVEPEGSSFGDRDSRDEAESGRQDPEENKTEDKLDERLDKSA